MTKLLSFAEWLGKQDSTEVDYAQSECEQIGCPYGDKPKCQRPFSMPPSVSCPLKMAYERQRDTDLQRWEKWNSEVH